MPFYGCATQKVGFMHAHVQPEWCWGVQLMNSAATNDITGVMTHTSYQQPCKPRQVGAGNIANIIDVPAAGCGVVAVGCPVAVIAYREVAW